MIFCFKKKIVERLCQVSTFVMNKLLSLYYLVRIFPENSMAVITPPEISFTV